MNKRITFLKDNFFNNIPQICPERGRIITESYEKNEGRSNIYKRAKAFEDILKNMTIYILPGELIVGNHASKPRSAPLFPEFSISFLLDEIDSFEERSFDKFLVNSETKKTIYNIAKYWKGKTHEDRVVFLTHKSLSPNKVKKVFDFNSFTLNDVCYEGVRKSSGDGHVIVNYKKILTLGLDGIIREAKSIINSLDIENSESIERKLFLESTIITCKAAIFFAKRYSSLAKKLAEKEDDLKRKEELLRISENCANIPQRPARDFWEALQAVWFIHLLIQIESNGHSISLGRFDQYLYKFYKRDIDSVLTKDQIIELSECFFLKINEINKVRPWSETQYKNGYPMFQTLTIGGQTSDGKDAANELTDLILQVSEELKLPQPTTILRVHNRTAENLVIRACRSLYKHGGGLPGFFNDEVIIPALMNIGIPIEEARKYAIVGCSEAVIPGKSLSFTGGVCYFNLPALLNLTLNGGENIRNGICLYLNPGNKNITNFSSFEELLKCFKKQLSYYIKFIVPSTTITSIVDKELNPTPFVSSLMDYRLKIAKDLSEGGGPNARYSNTVVQGHGIANVANSLAALEYIIYQKRLMSGEDVSKLLKSNFDVVGGNEIRQKLLTLPKYGNDDDSVDHFAQEIAWTFVKEIRKYKPWRGGVFGPTLQGLTANIPEGSNLGATPDGRKAGEPIADNSSPQAGTDIKGPTATMKTVSKIDHSLFVNGTILNIKIHPSALKGEGMNKFSALIRTYFDLKGYQVQFNIISSDNLRQAQLYPEANRSLIVKVAGYSAQFISLNKELQKQIIDRTEHILR